MFKPLQKVEIKEKMRGKVFITEGLEKFFGMFKKKILLFVLNLLKLRFYSIRRIFDLSEEDLEI